MRWYILFILIILVVYYLFLNCNPLDFSTTKKVTLNILKNNEPYRVPNTILLKNTDDIYILSYPKIFKPDICQGSGDGVKIINNYAEAENYIKEKKSYETIIVQDICRYSNEAGVSYARNPLTKKGKIISIVERRNKTCDNTLIWGYDYWTSQKFKNLYKNRPDLITTKLENEIDRITKNIPNMYVCRYDIKFRDENTFKEGKNFQILEVNGTMGYDLRAYVYPYNNFGILNPIHIKFILQRIYFGFCNLLLLNTINPYKIIYQTPQRIYFSIECSDCEKLLETSFT